MAIRVRKSNASLARALGSCAIAALAIECTPAWAAAAQEAQPVPTPSGASSSSTPDTSQEDTGQVGEVIVTAQRRSERLQKVPIAITAVSAAQLENAGVTSAFDLPKVAPGVTIKNQSQTFAPFIRGVGTSAFGPGIENPVALYVDNVYYASQFTAPSDLNEVSQVAILKGPQGTLFGRNATGGVIQLTTRDPEFTAGGEIRTELDQYLTSRNYAFLTTPLSDGLAVSVATHYSTQGEGWGRNLPTRKDNNKIDHDFGVRGKILFKPGSDTTIKLSADYSDLKNSLGPNLVTAPGYVGVAGPVNLGKNRYNSNNYIDNVNDTWNWGVSGNIEQGLGSVRLVSITAYRKFDFSTQFVPSATPFPAFDIRFSVSGKQFSQELQLLSDNTGPFKWVVGGYYFNGTERVDNLTNSFYGFYTGRGLQKINIAGSETTKSIAGFAQASYAIATGVNVTGGIRYTHDDRSVSNATTTGTLVGSGAVIPLGPPLNADQKINRLTWRAALDYQATPDLLLYASFNRGFKSGGFNLFDPSNPPYQPEKLNAYEAGFKSELLGRKVRLNASGFYYDYKQIQLTRILTTAQVINAPAAEFYGLDVDGAARITNALSLDFGLSWLHAKITDFKNATTIAPSPAGFVSVPFDASGQRLPFAAKLSFTLGATYRFDVAGAKFALSASESHNSGYFFEPDNVLRQKPFDLVNVGLTWTAPDDRLEIGAFVRNLLDETVFAQQSSSGNGRQADYGTPPITYGASLKYTF